jgi:glucosamine-6-phosphate deaminase
MVHVVRYESPHAWAEHVAARFASFLADEPAARVALPTGATPEPVYAGIVEAVRAGIASFRRADVFLLDEFGGVPPDAKGRCDVMLRRALLDHVDVTPGRYHRLDPEAADIEAMCAAYDAALTPPLDLVMLGIGRNGHVGMNEPGTPPDSVTRRVELAPSTTQASVRYFGEGAALPTWGITLGLSQILAARTIWMLATGDGKADIVRDVLLEPVSASRPASLLRGHPDCWFLLDAAAASKLPVGVLSRG